MKVKSTKSGFASTYQYPADPAPEITPAEKRVLRGSELRKTEKIDEITNRYWPNCQPVLVNRLPVFAKSPTRFLGIHFHQYRFVIWPIIVGDLANNCWRFGQY